MLTDFVCLYTYMSFDFPFERLFGNFVITLMVRIGHSVFYFYMVRIGHSVFYLYMVRIGHSVFYLYMVRIGHSVFYFYMVRNGHNVSTSIWYEMVIV
jgi:hypothetical protein